MSNINIFNYHLRGLPSLLVRPKYIIVNYSSETFGIWLIESPIYACNLHPQSPIPQATISHHIILYLSYFSMHHLKKGPEDHFRKKRSPQRETKWVISTMDSSRWRWMEATRVNKHWWLYPCRIGKYHYFNLCLVLCFLLVEGVVRDICNHKVRPRSEP